MAPTAAMLFLGYHQWNPKPSSFQYSTSNTPAFFHIKVANGMASRPPSSPSETIGQVARSQAAGEEGKEAKPPSLEDKFEESLQLSCWSL